MAEKLVPMFLLGCTGEFGCDCSYRRAGFVARDKNLRGHGTRTKYQYGCRCPFCRRANAGYTKGYRERKKHGHQDA